MFLASKLIIMPRSYCKSKKRKLNANQHTRRTKPPQPSVSVNNDVSISASSKKIKYVPHDDRTEVDDNYNIMINFATIKDLIVNLLLT